MKNMPMTFLDENHVIQPPTSKQAIRLQSIFFMIRESLENYFWQNIKLKTNDCDNYALFSYLQDA